MIVKLDALLVMSFFLACSMPAGFAGNTPTNTPPSTTNAATLSTTAIKTCFLCKGTGSAKCSDPGCKQGRAECPGPCLKLSKGVWEKRNVAGHTDPNELWQKVRYNARQTTYISSGHVGQYLVPGPDGNNTPVACKVCNGAAAIECAKCKGIGTAKCEMCEGKKTIPSGWTAFDNPKMKERPKRFVLKDGRVLVGKCVGILGAKMIIRTETGTEQIDQADLKPEKSEK